MSILLSVKFKTIKNRFQIKCGFFVNIFCLATNFLCVSTYGKYIYSLDDGSPDWTLDG
jgi:hypothetical protein